jgi:hypothetical protein
MVKKVVVANMPWGKTESAYQNGFKDLIIIQ